jgi:hypothetical protein
VEKDAFAGEVAKEFGVRPRRSDSLLQVTVMVLAVPVFLILCGFGLRALYHWIYSPDMSLPSLVEKVRGDIKAIEEGNSTSGWEVEEAEIEVNFIAKDTSAHTTELKATTSEVGSERENSHRLLLKLRRKPTGNPASKSNASPTTGDAPKAAH